MKNSPFFSSFQVQPILAAKSSENLEAAAAAAGATEDSKTGGKSGSKGSSSRPEAPPRSKSAKSREGFLYHCLAILILISNSKYLIL